MDARHATVFSDTRECAECGRLFPVSLRFASQEACDACTRSLKRSMARVKQYSTCESCGEEWPVMAKVARDADADGKCVCEDCLALDVLDDLARHTGYGEWVE